MHVTLESIVQYATLGTLLGGLISLVVWARIYRRKVNTQIFIEISARYAKLRSFPARLWARADSGQPLPERNDEFTEYVLQYLSMLVLAHVLHERRYLADDLWTVLRAEHQRTGANPLFEREWGLVKKQFEMYPNFIAYVDSLHQHESRNSVTGRRSPAGIGPSGAAAKLGLPGSTLESKNRSLKISKKRFKTTNPSADRV